MAGIAVQVVGGLVDSGAAEGGVVAFEDDADVSGRIVQQGLGEGGLHLVAGDDRVHRTDPGPDPIITSAGVFEDLIALDHVVSANVPVIEGGGVGGVGVEVEGVAPVQRDRVRVLVLVGEEELVGVVGQVDFADVDRSVGQGGFVAVRAERGEGGPVGQVTVDGDEFLRRGNEVVAEVAVATDPSRGRNEFEGRAGERVVVAVEGVVEGIGTERS